MSWRNILGVPEKPSPLFPSNFQSISYATVLTSDEARDRLDRAATEIEAWETFWLDTDAALAQGATHQCQDASAVVMETAWLKWRDDRWLPGD